MSVQEVPFRILALDGGGSKGLYSLGFLRQLEAHLTKVDLHSAFELIYGTSTGAIIAALIGLGKSIPEIMALYLEIVPSIMSRQSPEGRSAMLLKYAREIFGDKKFNDFKTRIAIVTTNYDFNRATIFKGEASQTYNMKSSFLPGFGCTIADAVIASSSAVPFFNEHVVDTENHGRMRLIDGGFVANNPSLFALTDATNSLGVTRSAIRLLSIGVGRYKQASLKMNLLQRFQYNLLARNFPIDILETTLNANANSTETLVRLLFPDIQYERIDEALTEKGFETNLLEENPQKLHTMLNHGQASFGLHQRRIEKLLSIN